MSDHVETMMWAGNITPWHRKGTYVGDQEINSEEAIVAAGLDWRVTKENMYLPNGDMIPEHFAITRDKDNRVLGVVQDRYEIVQNVRKFSFIDAVLGKGVCSIHTAGSLKGGKIVWVLAKLAGIARIKDSDDTIERYLLLSSAHDGSMPVQAQFTPTRVVCANTLNYAMQNRTNVVKVRHTRNVESFLKAAETTMKSALDFYEQFEVKANWLADQRFTELQINEALNKILGVKDENNIPTRTKNTIDKIKDLSENGMGNAQWAGSAWAFLNGVSEYADHHKTVRNDNDDTRLFSNWFGTAVDLKQRSYNVVDNMLSNV